jgi:hypothetical protein
VAMKIRILLLFVLLLVFQSCSDVPNSEQSTSNEIIFDSIVQISKTIDKDTLLATESAKSDTIQIHIFQKGQTLWDLCKTYYGNRHYSSILSIYNEIQDVNRIEPGTAIKVPPFNKILTDKNFGLVPPLEKEVYKILAARQLYIEVEPTIWELRRSLNWKGNQALPEDIVSNLINASGLIELTISQLNQPKEGATTLPSRMLDNLKSVSRNLKHLASGANDGYGYDLDMVHQDLIRAIHNGRAWVKNNYKKG